jgi:hypothetical protein
MYLKFENSANIIPKKLFLEKFHMGIKNAELSADFKLEVVLNNFLK